MVKKKIFSEIFNAYRVAQLNNNDDVKDVCYLKYIIYVYEEG